VTTTRSYIPDASPRRWSATSPPEDRSRPSAAELDLQVAVTRELAGRRERLLERLDDAGFVERASARTSFSAAPGHVATP